MAARKKTKGINLAPQDKFSETTTGRVLAWLLSTFRFMVILVELIVMGAFLSRFWLDARNSDLNDEIKQKKARILASSEVEKEMRAAQKKLMIFTALAENKISYPSELQKLTPLIPDAVFLRDVSINQDLMVITGDAPDEQSILQTLVNLENAEYKSVDLTDINIENEGEFKIVFSINIKLE